MKTTTTPSPNPEQDDQCRYISGDKLVSVHILREPQRFPRHSYRCAVLRFRPTPHTRIRILADGTVEWMAAKEELAAFASAFEKCDPDFQITFGRPMINKSPEKKASWDQFNRRRHSEGKGYRRFSRYNRR